MPTDVTPAAVMALDLASRVPKLLARDWEGRAGAELPRGSKEVLLDVLAAADVGRFCSDHSNNLPVGQAEVVWCRRCVVVAEEGAEMVSSEGLD